MSGLEFGWRQLLRRDPVRVPACGAPLPLDMIRISQLKLPVGFDEEKLRTVAARALRLPPAAISGCRLHKWSVDARGRQGVSVVAVADVEVRDERVVLERCAGDARVRPAPDESYRELEGVPDFAPPEQGRRPVVVGSGPCGLICALLLARHGLAPVVLERGKAAGDRARDVTGFWRRDWAFDPESNVQFGEGGAGTFSDGKLYTQIRDREHRIPWLLHELVAAGAPEDILVKGKPHIGTDRLIKVVRHLREEIISLGGEVRFGAKLVDVVLEGGAVRGVVVEGDDAPVPTDTVVVAVGHSARDSFEVLRRAGVRFEAKPFSIGVRIEHPQSVIDRAQFGDFAGHPSLGSAAYKCVHHVRGTGGRSAYSFCMCPGGLVVAAASEPGGVVTNGMSSYARAEANANSGLMVEVEPGRDFPDDDPFAGIEFQRRWERAAFELGGGGYRAPVQTVGDFLAGRPSTTLGSVVPSYQPGVTPADLSRCLPEAVVETLRAAIPAIGRKIRGFDLPDAVLVGVETRSSAPVRMERDPETLEAAGVAGLYPAGEGAGYAGGIVSAAVDGMRVAEVVLGGWRG